jgi:hypothetical protein
VPHLYSRNGKMVSKAEYDEWRNPKKEEVKKVVKKKAMVKKPIEPVVPIAEAPVPPAV